MSILLTEIKDGDSIGIGGHIRPDGDCVGSCMALYQYLSRVYPNSEINVYLEKISESFAFLKDISLVQTAYEKHEPYTVFISLDCGSLDRLGMAKQYFDTATKTINIDHHVSNTEFAEVNYVLPHASSTCEVLYGLFQEAMIDESIATSLYLGIAHDTGVFIHSNTTKHTLSIVGALIEKGISFSKIINESFYQKTYIQNQVLGRCLLESILVLDGKCIVSMLSRKIMEFYGASPEDLDGIIDQLRVTKGVEVALFIYETDTLQYKASMRSNGDVDVSKIAVYFGGGGHVKAAGCNMSGTAHDVVNNIITHIEHQLIQGE